jgi:hypothetical protein
MQLAVALTLWLGFGAFLILPTLNAPPMFGNVAIGLCGAELVACVVWLVGADNCLHRPCGAFAETGRSAAALDIPVLTGVVLVLAAAHGVRVARSW